MEVNGVNSFADNTRNLSTKYDFNKDGTVDIQDYNYAILSLNDDDPDNDVELSKDELDKIFADLITEDDKVNPDTAEVNIDNVTKLAQEVTKKASTDIVDPSTASDFAELQEIGKNLSKIIKRCAKLLPYLNQQMEVYEAELEKIAEEKEAKEKDYELVAGEVDQKNEQLSNKMAQVMTKSDSVTDDMQRSTKNIISNCVENYKNGDYEGQDLLSVIVSALASDSSCNMEVNSLNSLINDCGAMGDEIKSLCSDIENIVSDIRGVTQKYNNTTNLLNNLKDSRTNVLTTSSQASAAYQKGYQRRLELRQEISKQFGSGLDGLKAFVESDTCTSIPFSDAYAIMQDIAKDTNIKFTDGNIIMPTFIYWNSPSEITSEQKEEMNKCNEISAIINEKFASSGNNFTKKTGDGNEDDAVDDGLEDVADDALAEVDLEDVETGDVEVEDEELDEEEFNTGEPSSLGCCTESTCCDPISFKQGNTSYHFISDNDKDGTFDGASEFLGANNGWEEMKAYDANGDGKISGSELDKLKLVSVNDDSGQYNFMSAKEAGISEIDLSSYEQSNEKQTDGDMLRGTFELKMQDGSVIQGEQTDDSAKNIENRYSTLFGASIEDTTDDYEDSEYMDEFIEKIDTQKTVNQNESSLNAAKNSSDNKINSVKSSASREASVQADVAENEKNRDDEATSKKEEAENQNNNPFFNKKDLL